MNGNDKDLTSILKGKTNPLKETCRGSNGWTVAIKAPGGFDILPKSLRHVTTTRDRNLAKEYMATVDITS
jgi:hypothetical protein